MNEHIKALALKAGFAEDSWGVYAPAVDGAPLDDELKEFAELIIRECLDIMDKERFNSTMLTSNPMQSGAIWDAKNEIENRFGIKP